MEHTEKLGLPIPVVTRGGDVNDVLDITNSIEQLLNYIDAGSGDYNTAVAFENFVEQTVTGQTFVELAEIVGEQGMIFPAAPEEEPATPGYPTKIGWIPEETDYARINEDATITIKAGGNYRFFVQLFYTTASTDGDVSIVLERNDYHDVMNTSYVHVQSQPITGEAFFRALPDNPGVERILGAFQPSFYGEDTLVKFKLFLSDAAAEMEVAMVSVSLERL